MGLNELLKKNDMSMRQLSIKANVAYSTIRDLCTNKVMLENASGRTLLAISKALYMSIESLLNSENSDIIRDSLYVNSKKYLIENLKNKKNVILRSLSALDYYGYLDRNNSKDIFVYSIYKLDKPYIYKQVKNFSKIKYTYTDNILVSTLSQSINDVLSDANVSIKMIKEILLNIKLDDQLILDNLEISKANKTKFDKLVKSISKK